MPKGQIERHRTNRVGWLRAAVLGANDGVLSTASLVLGVAAAHGSHKSVLVAGVAGLVAGAMSMAAGEYVSVHSQADAEKADLRLERREIRVDSKGEHRELAAIYVDRGLDPALAKQVAQQLMAHNALQAHARDELGITEVLRARPIQAGLTSALSFAVGAVLPLLISSLAPQCVRQGIYDRIRKGITAPSGCKNARAGPTIPSALLICPAPHLSPSTLLSPSIPDASRSRAIIVGRNSTLTFEREESRLTERLDYLARGSLPGH